MAIITEEEAEHNVPKAQSKRPSKSKPQQNPTTSSMETKTHKSSSPPSSPFAFWFYFTLTISLVSLLFVSFNSLAPRDPKSWFLSLPSDLRQHYSKGRTIKVQTQRHQSPFEVFAFEQGRSESETVLIVHGLGLSSYSFKSIVRSLSGKGVRTVAIDLPGHGFSDKSVMEEAGGRSEGVLGRLRDVYDEIQEKGLFSAFDRIIETGQMPYEEIEARISERKVSKPIEFGPEEIGKVLGQVIEAMDLSPIHLVLHDSALGMAANWVSQNSKALRSVTLLDTARGSFPVLPLWALSIPVVRELVLGSSTVHAWLLKKCCSREMGSEEARAHRALLTSRDARSSIVGIGRNLNSSFDVSKWELKGVPIQVVWSKSWSQEWTAEGERVSEFLPQASFSLHSGGRWPQEGSVDEIAQSIFQFVSSLPATIRKTEEEPIPDHIQRKLDEAKNNAHQHHHDHDGHAHGHEAGFMNPYGLNHDHGW